MNSNYKSIKYYRQKTFTIKKITLKYKYYKNAKINKNTKKKQNTI